MPAAQPDPMEDCKAGGGGHREQSAPGADLVLVDRIFAKVHRSAARAQSKMVKLLGKVDELAMSGFYRARVMRDWHVEEGDPDRQFVIADGCNEDGGYADWPS